MKKWWPVILLMAGLIILLILSLKKEELVLVQNPVLTPTVMEKKLIVAVGADVHGDGEQLEKMLIMAKKDKVDMVLLAGDITDKGKVVELKKIKNILEESELKYAVVPGNHEYDRSAFRDFFGRNYQSIVMEKVKFILIDNGYWQGLGEEQRIWLEEEVEDCRILTCLAIMHKPLNNNFSLHVMGENNKKVTAEAKWLIDLLVKSGVRQIEAGHLHYASSYELDGIRTDIVGALSKEKNNQSPRYTQLMIGEKTIERRVVEVE